MELGGRRGWMLGADLEKEAALFGTILLAVDGSSYAEKAVQLTRRLAAGGDDEVVVAHVSEFLPAPFQTWNALVRPCWSAPCCHDCLAFGPPGHAAAVRGSGLLDMVLAAGQSEGHERPGRHG